MQIRGIASMNKDMISDHNCIDETKGLIIKWTNCLKSEFGEKYPEGGWYCHNVEGSDWISFESKADHEKRFEHSNAEQRALRQSNKIAMYLGYGKQ